MVRSSHFAPDELDGFCEAVDRILALCETLMTRDDAPCRKCRAARHALPMVGLVIVVACNAPRPTTRPLLPAYVSSPPAASALPQPNLPAHLVPKLGDEVDQHVGIPNDPHIAIAGSTIAFVCHSHVPHRPDQ